MRRHRSCRWIWWNHDWFSSYFGIFFKQKHMSSFSSLISLIREVTSAGLVENVVASIMMGFVLWICSGSLRLAWMTWQSCEHIISKVRMTRVKHYETHQPSAWYFKHLHKTPAASGCFESGLCGGGKLPVKDSLLLSLDHQATLQATSKYTMLPQQ